jgi:hypothetical protein
MPERPIERPIITCKVCADINCKGFASNPDVRLVEDKDGEVIVKYEESIANCQVLFDRITEEYFLWLLDWARTQGAKLPAG